jgi:hypothetical protein
MRGLVLAAVLLSLVACDGTSHGQPDATSAPFAPAAAPTRAPTAAPTPIPLINVDDMMGLYPQQTVFVASSDRVTAVTLLNHFIRYRIPTNGVAQVSSDRTGQRLYLLDAEEAPGSHRLRAFNVATGSELAAHSAIADIVLEDRRVLATLIDGRVLVLKSDAQHAWVDAYEALTLRPLGQIMEKPGCGDQLITSARRVAIVCMSTGEIAVDDLRGNHAEINATLPNLVAAAMADDGTLFVATADQHLATVGSGATELANLQWPSEWSGTVIPDGIAVAQGSTSTVIAERTDDGAWLRVFTTNNIARRKSLRLAGVPQGGVLALWPFAYYTVDSTIRHVDLDSGLLETMAEVGAAAVPGAVVNG